MLRFVIALLLSFAAVGCMPTQPAQHFPYRYDGTPKPRLAIIPIIDSSECSLPWRIDQEINNSLRYQLMCDDKLYLLPEGEKRSPSELFSPDLTFSKQFCGADFLVALELIDHLTVPFEKSKVSPCFPCQTQRCNSMLQMKIRLRLIDLRCANPRVILQEIFTSNMMIPKEAECLDYERLGWGTQGFLTTPIGMAHKRMVLDLACRIETIIEEQ